MTYNITNPNMNPKKLTRKQRKAIWKASQICHNTPIKSANTASVGYVSSFNSFMTEFNSQKDKTPKSFESWRRVHNTGIDENGNETWTKPQTLPRHSVSFGLGKGKAPKREYIEEIDLRIATTELEKGIQHELK